MMKNNIKKLRLTVPIGQRQFAIKMGVKPSTLANYENGLRGVNVDNAWNIVNQMRAIGLNVEFKDVFPNPTEQEKAA